MLTGVARPTLVAQDERGPFARIAVLRPHDGATVDFEAGYMRHLEWHRQAKDPFVWYGWTIWAGARQRWFVYATFGHSAASLNNPVAPADDEQDNVRNVTPHAEFVENAVYEYLPALSSGAGVPQPTPRMEMVTIELKPGAAKNFEAVVGTLRASARGDTLWYRMVAGGTAPRYVRLRPRSDLAAIFDVDNDEAFHDKVGQLVSKITIEILNLRQTMSHGLTTGRQ